MNALWLVRRNSPDRTKIVTFRKQGLLKRWSPFDPTISGVKCKHDDPMCTKKVWCRESPVLLSLLYDSPPFYRRCNWTLDNFTRLCHRCTRVTRDFMLPDVNSNSRLNFTRNLYFMVDLKFFNDLFYYILYNYLNINVQFYYYKTYIDLFCNNF